MVPRRGQFGIAVAFGLLFVGACGSAGTAQSTDTNSREGIEFFEKKIRPLLVERCYECHSDKAKKPKGGLRLDSRQGILRGGDSGPAVVPGDLERSRLIRAIRYSDAELRMPPKRKLLVEEIAALEAWVKRGAPVPGAAAETPTTDPDKFWAFQSPKAPTLPDVKHQEWVRKPIDRFILAKLEEKRLLPAPAADKAALIRRVTFDLTGLPPRPKEVAAFLRDESPVAFAKVVDRLLASPHYGERWGRHWLDLVRYTDDFDQAWRYRDWVVSAFNLDLPYDQFIAHQVAGDLLPAASSPGRDADINADGIIATTMLSIGPWSGLDHKKRLTDIVDDQLDIIGRTFLGLTVACARCHNHKFDPITTADYYGMAGIFFSSRVISDLAYLSHGTALLRIPLVSKAEVERHDRLQANIQELEDRLQAAVEKQYADFARGLLPHTSKYLLAAWEFQHRPADQPRLSVAEFAAKRQLHAFALEQWVNYLAGAHLEKYRLLDMPSREFDGEPGVQAWRTRAERPWWAANSNRHDVAIETFLLPGRSVSINPGDAAGAVGWKSPITGTVRIAGQLTDCDPHDGTGVAWVVDHESGGVRRELSSGSMANGSSKRLDQGRTPERLASVSVKAGDVIYLQVRLRQGDAHYDITRIDLTITRLDGPERWDLANDVLDNLLEGNPHRDSHGHAAVWHFYDANGNNRLQRMPAVEPLLDRYKAATAKFSASGGRRPPVDRPVLEQAAAEFQKAIHAAGPDSPLVQDLTGPISPFWVHARDDSKYLSADARAALAKQASELNSLKSQLPPLPCAHGIQEGGLKYSLYPGFGDVPIHNRGSYEQLGARAPRRFPLALAKDRQPSIRSGSGRAELARWLGSEDNPLTARVMVNRIWQHHFGEGIVRTPSNFGSKGEGPTHPELLDWLAGQFVRSGWSVKALHRLILLSAAYQQSSKAGVDSRRGDPENGLLGRMNRRRLEAESLRDSLLFLTDKLDARRGGPADGDSLSQRRMIYLRNSRSDRSGLGPLFDVANPSIHVERRTVSTIAPQSLFLMNSPWALDIVRQIAHRPDLAGEKDHARRITALYRLLYGRDPTAKEAEVGREFLKTGGALKPWETYVQALVLSNEFLFVD